MFEARRWRCDARFKAPMTTLSNGVQVFVDDFVYTSLHFFCKIKALLLEV